MADGKADMFDGIRKIVSFVVLAAAVLALVTFFWGSGVLVFEDIIAAFNPFDWQLLGAALYDFMAALSVPLIMILLGLLGVTVDH